MNKYSFGICGRKDSSEIRFLMNNGRWYERMDDLTHQLNKNLQISDKKQFIIPFLNGTKGDCPNETMMSDEEAYRSLFQLKMNLSLIPPNHPHRYNLADFLKEQYGIPKVQHCELCDFSIRNRVHYAEHVTGITHWNNIQSAGLKFSRNEYEMLLRAIHQTALSDWTDFDLKYALQLKKEVGDRTIIPFFTGVEITDENVDQLLTKEQVDLLTRKLLYTMSKIESQLNMPMDALIRRVFNMSKFHECQFCKLKFNWAITFIKHVLSEEHMINMSHEGRSFKRDDYVLLQRAIQASHPESWIKQDDADFLAKDGTVPCAATIKTYPFMGSYPAVGYGHFLASLTQKDLEYFTGKIRRRLNSMTDSQKTAFAELLKKKFDIPNKFPCTICETFIDNQLHYVRHVINKKHLEKALKEPGTVFTKTDYKHIRDAINLACQRQIVSNDDYLHKYVTAKLNW